MNGYFSGEPRGFVRSRPIRVAFLLSEGEHDHIILDAIFAESFARWGGRYSLVCPCENGFLSERYLSWLRVFDPDILYSFIDLTEENLHRLREQLGPAYLVRHDGEIGPNPTMRDFRVRLPLPALASISIALQYARAFPASAPQPMSIVDYLPGQQNDRFIDDNFGTYSNSYGQWPLPGHLADAIKPLTVASEELLNRPNSGRFQGETVFDATALLREMVVRRNSYGLAQVAADSTPRIELRENFNDAFKLVIGDSFADRVYYWNCRSRAPAFLGKEFVVMIVSPARLDDTEFFAALVEFLKARNGVPRSSGTPWVQLVSSSICVEKLTDIKDRMRALDKWNGYQVAPTVTLDSIAPDGQVLKEARDLVAGGFLDRSPEWREFPASGSATRPPVTLPKHLEHVQGLNAATGGAWALDVEIQRQENYSRFFNERHPWRFPRRLRFFEAFRSPYEGRGASRDFRLPRANKDGQLVLFTELGEEPPLLNIPSDETAFQFGLQRGDAWPPFHRLDAREEPHGAVGWSRPSDKGRYLIGALRLFGGLRSAAPVLLHNYWRGLFEELGGAVGTARRDQIKESFRKKVRTVTTRPSEWTEDTWDRLAALVAAEAHQVRIPQQSLSFEQLRKRHKPYIEKERALLMEQQADEPEEWIALATRSLARSVKELCGRKVLFQGYEWRCDACFNTNWNDLNALSTELSCAICGATEAAPVDEPWSFRLNGFLQDAMREHGLLALVWCLIKLSNRARTTFFFLGPHDLWKTYPRDERAKRDHEADLIAVVDERVHLCEAKSSSRDIDLESLIEVAKRLRPDVVTLAVMEPASPRSTAKLDELRRLLADTDIQSELLTLRDDPDWNDANLP